MAGASSLNELRLHFRPEIIGNTCTYIPNPYRSQGRAVPYFRTRSSTSCGARYSTPVSYVYVHLLLCNFDLITISFVHLLIQHPSLDSYISNKGKTAYVYPAYKLSLSFMALA
jgi:hypothetical protein